jgi:hypothetical protein
VHQRAALDAEHRDQPGASALVDSSRDDVEHGRARDGYQRGGGRREQNERLDLWHGQ